MKPRPKILAYVIVQRTGFVPYFLSTWRDGADSWDCLRARALGFDGPTARRIADRLNARRPAAPLPVTIEVLNADR
jgi:hypothetical protein